MIVMHAALPIDPNGKAEAIDLLVDLAEQSRAEDGVIEYRVTTDAEDPNTIRVFEQYEDDGAVDDHMSSDHFQTFQADIEGYIAGEPTLTRFDVSAETDVM